MKGVVSKNELTGVIRNESLNSELNLSFAKSVICIANLGEGVRILASGGGEDMVLALVTVIEGDENFRFVLKTALEVLEKAGKPLV